MLVRYTPFSTLISEVQENSADWPYAYLLIRGDVHKVDWSEIKKKKIFAETITIQFSNRRIKSSPNFVWNFGNFTQASPSVHKYTTTRGVEEPTKSLESLFFLWLSKRATSTH